MTRPLPVSVVICTMNRPDSLERTLRVMVTQGLPPDQIVVIDQSRQPAIRHRVQQVVNAVADYTRSEYHYQDEASLTQARNRGLALCDHDVVIHCDDDVDVETSTLIEIHRIMTNQDVAMIAGLDAQSVAESTSIWNLLGYVFLRKTWGKSDEGYVTKAMLGRLPQTIDVEVSTQWAMGFLCVFRKSLLNKWSLTWDESLRGYAYPEDLDLSFGYWRRATAEGLRCIASPKVRARHLVSQEYRTASFTHTMMFIVHREYLSYKHAMPFTSRLATRWANFGELLRRLGKRESVLDVLAAQWYCDRNRGQLRRGQLPPVLGLSRMDAWRG